MSSILREMYMSDLVTVLEIIETHDEDDGEAAESEFDKEGIENHFVAENDGAAIGITGFREIEGCDQTYWLSWTYLSESFHGQGIGKKMLLELLDKLRERGARKIFVKVSDYQDPEDGNIYAAALAAYKSVGFEEEVVSKDFYDQDESQTILSLKLDKASDESEQEIEIADEKPVIRFNGLFEIAETEGAYSFAWTVEKRSGLFGGNRSFSQQDLMIGLSAVKDQGGRKVFLTFPSNLVLIHRPLQAVGFKFIGQLKDYYEVGLHELHFSHDLSNVE